VIFAISDFGGHGGSQLRAGIALRTRTGRLAGATLLFICAQSNPQSSNQYGSCASAIKQIYATGK
jgi:hypothetical protein